MTATELAAYVGVHIKTVHRWRRTGKGPRALTTEAHPRYLPADVEQWLTSPKVKEKVHVHEQRKRRRRAAKRLSHPQHTGCADYEDYADHVYGEGCTVDGSVVRSSRSR